MSDPSKFLAVAAIDFGTTFSGWALSFRHQYERDPLKVQTKQWHNGESMSLKTSTAVLVQPDGKTLEAFGYEAENRFQEIVEDDPTTHSGYYYFKRFKMVLFQKNDLSRKTELIAGNGTKLPAIRVFKLAIKRLKDDVLDECGKRLDDHGVVTKDIHWTLTVPAIWKEKAKNFMREAAIEAGIPSNNLTIVLEPEAASIYCKSQPVSRDKSGVESFKSGTKYIVLDCGGGTIDISCHQIVDKQIKEIHKVKGNDLGGTCVDMAFENLLRDLFGVQVWNRFLSERMQNYVSFIRQFESKKRDISLTSDMNVTLPYDLYELYKDVNNVEFKVGLAKTAFKDKVTIKPGTKVQFKADFITKLLFDKSVAGIIKCVKNILQSPSMQGTKHLLLVGGYGESKVIQQRLREEFPSMTIVVPQEPGLAVLIGAVILGHDTSVVKERVTQFTYGTRIAIDYDPKVHSADKIVNYDGRKKVLTFKELVKSNQTIGTDFQVDLGDYVPASDSQTTIEFPVYAVDMDRKTDADDEDDDDGYIPVYSSDPRCTELGIIAAPVTNRDVPRNDRKFNLKIMLGKTEIDGVVTNKLSKEKTKAQIDFIA